MDESQAKLFTNFFARKIGIDDELGSQVIFDILVSRQVEYWLHCNILILVLYIVNGGKLFWIPKRSRARY